MPGISVVVRAGGKRVRVVKCGGQPDELGVPLQCWLRLTVAQAAYHPDLCSWQCAEEYAKRENNNHS